MATATKPRKKKAASNGTMRKGRTDPGQKYIKGFGPDEDKTLNALFEARNKAEAAFRRAKEKLSTAETDLFKGMKKKKITAYQFGGLIAETKDVASRLSIHKAPKASKTA